MSDPSDGIDPESMKEVEAMMEAIARKNEQGYMIELYVSRLEAEDMVKGWMRGLMGSDEELELCLRNYSYIMVKLMNQMKRDDNP